MFAPVRLRATAALMLGAAMLAVIGLGMLARQSSVARADNPGQATVVVTWTDPSKAAPGTSGGFNRSDSATGIPAYQAPVGTIYELDNKSHETVQITIRAKGKNVLAPLTLSAASATFIGLPPGTYLLQGAGAAGVAYHVTKASLRLAAVIAPTPSRAASTPAGSATSGLVAASSRGSASVAVTVPGSSSLPPTGAVSPAPRAIGAGHNSGRGRGFGLPAAVAVVVFLGVVGALARVLLSGPFIALTSGSGTARGARVPRDRASSHRR